MIAVDADVLDSARGIARDIAAMFAPQLSAHVSAPQSILVIEDDSLVLSAVCRTLAPHGVPIEHASTMADVIAAFTRHPFSVVVTDLHFDEGSPGLMIAGIRDADVIAISGVDETQLAEAAREMGAVAAIHKTESNAMAKLFAAVGRSLAAHEQHAPPRRQGA